MYSYLRTHGHLVKGQSQTMGFIFNCSKKEGYFSLSAPLMIQCQTLYSKWNEWNLLKESSDLDIYDYFILKTSTATEFKALSPIQWSLVYMYV